MTTDTVEVPKGDPMPLVFFPDTILAQVSTKVSFEPGDGGEWVADLAGLALDLVATMKGNQGAGLSAVQVGLPIRIIVIAGKGEGDEPLVMVNPDWHPAGTEKSLMNEGCLSFPALFEDVERFESVVAVWRDVDGTTHDAVFTGTQAQAIQHECEHLEGKLLIDNLPFHKRERVRQKMKQRARLTARIDRVMKKGGGSLQSLISSGLIRSTGQRKGFRSAR